MNERSPLPALNHHCLRFGKTSTVARTFQHPLQGAVATTIQYGLREGRPVTVAGSPFELMTNMSAHEHGNAVLGIVAGAPLGGGRVPAETLMYVGSVACHLPTAPLAWRFVMRRYLAYAASAPPLHSLGAPSRMPKETPWLCGYTTVAPVQTAENEWKTMVAIQRLAAMDLLRRCERVCEEAAMTGGLTTMDPERFPELCEWED